MMVTIFQWSKQELFAPGTGKDDDRMFNLLLFITHKEDPSSKTILLASQFGQLKIGGSQVGSKNFSLPTSSFHSCYFTYKEADP